MCIQKSEKLTIVNVKQDPVVKQFNYAELGD